MAGERRPHDHMANTERASFVIVGVLAVLMLVAVGFSVTWLLYVTAGSLF